MPGMRSAESTPELTLLASTEVIVELPCVCESLLTLTFPAESTVMSVPLLTRPAVEEVAIPYVWSFSAPHVAVPSALQRRICPELPPDGMCLFPLVVG